MSLDIQTSLAEIDEMYANAGADTTLGALISGEGGVGKTAMCCTAPKPILFYQFDPKGSIVIERRLKNTEKKIVPLWADQSQSPTEWKKFLDLTDKHMELGIFDLFATVVVDSLTFALEACTHYVANMAPKLKLEKNYTERPRNIPFIGDYRIIYQELMDRIKRFSAFNINLIFTSHIETEADEITGEIKSNILAYRKLKGLIPPMFTEKYVIVTKPRSGQIAERILLTQPRGRYMASSQLGLDPEEKPDFREIMKKSGLNFKDKPLLDVK